ncbi:MAG: hypothetical protein IPN70_01810 [Candidatus Moraniibacteriota bacterium]|nr:MAG: hypothetical protein IPN70_01810 [Candidatus Moranbacteria bacterium]
MSRIDIYQTKKRNQKPERDEIFFLSRGVRSNRFFTEDSYRYITSHEEVLFHQNYRRIERRKLFDGVMHRQEKIPYRNILHDTQKIRWALEGSWFQWRRKLVDVREGLEISISPIRAWNFSLVGAVLFGMLSMSMIYRSFGQSVSAQKEIKLADESAYSEGISEEEGIVLGEAIEFIQKSEADYLMEIKEDDRVKEELRKREESEQTAKKKAFQKEIRDMVKGYPIEQMLPYIFEQDDIIAAYLIAIAKKESNWGKRVPVLEGEDCFNYWGYRSVRERMGTGGHTCFDSPKEAIDIVGKRISWFVYNQKRETPEDLIIWKCGSSCAAHDPYSVKKWIQDVDLYFSKIYTKNSQDSL